MDPNFSIHMWFQNHVDFLQFFSHKSNDYDIGAPREFIQQPREFVQSNCSSGHETMLSRSQRPVQIMSYSCPFIKIYIPIGSMYAIYANIYHQYTPNVSIYTIHGSYGICPIICVKNLSSPPENTPCCVPLVARGEPRLFTTTSGPNGRVEQVTGTSIAHSWPIWYIVYSIV